MIIVTEVRILMICNICKLAGDYYAKHKKNKKKLELANARQLHSACKNSPRNNGSCYCGHKTKDEVE